MNDSRQIAAEQHDLAGHTHSTDAEHHGKEDHLSGHESSRQALEHTNQAYLGAQHQHPESRFEHAVHGAARKATEQDIAVRAFQLWQGRNCPQGSPGEDWFRAVEELSVQP